MYLFWVTTFFFTVLGGFIVWVFFYKVAWGSWVTYKRRKDYEARNPKRTKSWRKKNKNKKSPNHTRFVDYLVGIPVMFIAFFCVPAFCFWLAFPAWLDLPRAVTGNYAVVTGTVTNIRTAEFEGKSWGYPYYTTIENNGYQSTIPVNVILGETITVETLPHSKVIVKVKE